jgi:GDPmannose 4,6-dehydratase
MAKRALICGISGQDGTYLAELLLRKGYEVFGSARDAQIGRFHNLELLGIKQDVTLLSMALNDFRSVLQTIVRVRPDEIYNLAAQSSVGLSFEQPLETRQSISGGTLNMLEAIRFVKEPIRFYNAGSSECFGDTGGMPADEKTLFNPRSPYAVTKASAFWWVSTYREAYDLFACTGILFNHESPLRPKRFVTRKIVSAACRIAAGENERLDLGNISIARDWGWAPEYVYAIWRMLQQDSPDDFVIATGETNSLLEFVSQTFAYLGLDWREYVSTNASLLRPSEIMVSRGNPAKAEKQLGWKARYTMDDVIRMMIEAELEYMGQKNISRPIFPVSKPAPEPASMSRSIPSLQTNDSVFIEAPVVW